MSSYLCFLGAEIKGVLQALIPTNSNEKFEFIFLNSSSFENKANTNNKKKNSPFEINSLYILEHLRFQKTIKSCFYFYLFLILCILELEL